MLTPSELQREQAWSRIYLVPAILAEQDRDAYRRQQASIAREKEIMKDVPDWKVRCIAARKADRQAGESVYNTKRYTPSTIVVL